MAQKITFTFNNISIIGDLSVNFKFNNGIDYFNENIIFTNFLLVDSHRVYCGSNTTEFATNFKNILLGLFHPNSSIPFFNKVTQVGNVVEVITGSTTTLDYLFINNVNTDVGSFGSFANYSRTIYTSNNLLISWGGASDDHGISGYEVTYRANTSSFWLGPIFVGSTFSGGLLEIPIVGSVNRDYTIRVRTKDDAGQYSDYKIISNLIRHRRSLDIAFDCSEPTSIPIYMNSLTPTVGETTYIDSSYSSTFNGLTSSWTISDTDGIKYLVDIDSNGLITNSLLCSIPANISFRSTNKVSLSSTMCSVICNVPVYYSQDLIGVGVILYNDELLSSPFTYTSTANDYYLIDSFYVCRIDRTNGTITDLKFRSSYCTTTTGGGGGCCLLPGTLITLSNGGYKNIEDIEIGDSVKSYDITNNLVTNAIVTKTFNTLKNDIISIRLSNGNVIDCTTSHPIWSINRNNWVSYNPFITKKYMNLETLNLSIDDILLDINGNSIKIIGIDIISTDLVNTYDISVEPYNNYYANNILVHNKILPEDPIDTLPNQF